MALHVLDVCAGYGGLSLALRFAGLDVRTVAHVEREAHAAATLVARMADQALDLAPVWDDLATFPADDFHGCVDIITAGLPCQPFSAAGRKLGLDDDRWLWPVLWSVVQRCGARWLFLENVPQFRRHGLVAVLADLRKGGWDAEWMLLSAADVGAPHKRERFWLLAQSDGARLERAGFRQHELDECRDDVAHSSGALWPPGRDDHDGWVEWIADGGPEPQLRRVPDGPAGRLVRPVGLGDRLHLLGNGVVPASAAVAFLLLAERLDRRPKEGLT